MREKIGYINALKGIACLGVFIHHLFLFLLPATYTGLESDSVLPGDYLLGSTPFGIIINGNFYVCLFLIISAFLLSRSIFISNGKKEHSMLLKRYPRLMLPVLCVNIISIALYYILVKLNINVTNVIKTNFWGAIRISLFDIWFTDTIKVAGYWMMYILFSGSIIAIIVSAIINKVSSKLYARLVLLFIFLFFILFGTTYYIATFLGIWLAYESYKSKQITYIKTKLSNKAVRILLSILLLSSFLYFGGYPSSGNVFNNVYLIFNYFPNVIKYMPHVMHIFGAFALMLWLSLFECPIFNNQLFSFLGDISYSIYLIHPLVNSYFANPLNSFLTTVLGMNTGISTTIITISTVAIVITLSWLFFKFIESKLDKITTTFINKVIH